MPKTVTVRKRDLEVDFNTGLDVTLDDPLFEVVYQNVKSAVQGKEINATTLITITTLAMQVVGKVPELTGAQKKNLVVQLITKLISEIDMSEDDLQAINLLVQTTLPGLIDALCSAASGSFDFKGSKDKLRKLFSCCLPSHA